MRRLLGRGCDADLPRAVTVLQLLLVIGCLLPISCFKPAALPEYCSKLPDGVDGNAPPPLQQSLKESFGSTAHIQDVQLLQLQVVIRHGSRSLETPVHCWQDYRPHWNCSVTELQVPVLSGSEGTPGPCLFKRTYDAFPSLGSSCPLGWLLGHGYEQQIQNGRNLQAAYFCKDPHCLWQPSELGRVAADELYLRSDNIPRTIYSGQALTQSFLNLSRPEVLPWHLGDFDLDYLYPNQARCPRLSKLADEATSSLAYQELMYNSAETQRLNQDLMSVLGLDVLDWRWVMDCLVTSMCSGQDLPDGMTEDLLEQAMALSTWDFLFPFFYGDREYARLSVGPLVHEMSERIQQAAGGAGSYEKFALYSAHDTTLISLLAALVPSSSTMSWPPYASMLAVEVMQVKGRDQGPYFRMSYNGQVQRVQGCDHDICPVSIFVEAAAFSGSLDCSMGGTDGDVGVLDTQLASQPASYSGGVLVGFALACFLIGLVTGAAPLAVYMRASRFQALMHDSQYEDVPVNMLPNFNARGGNNELLAAAPKMRRRTRGDSVDLGSDAGEADTALV